MGGRHLQHLSCVGGDGCHVLALVGVGTVVLEALIGAVTLTTVAPVWLPHFAVFLMCILGMVFYSIYIFVPLPTPHHRADVRLVLIVAASVASEREFTLTAVIIYPAILK